MEMKGATAAQRLVRYPGELPSQLRGLLLEVQGDAKLTLAALQTCRSLGCAAAALRMIHTHLAADSKQLFLSIHMLRPQTPPKSG